MKKCFTKTADLPVLGKYLRSDFGKFLMVCALFLGCNFQGNAQEKVSPGTKPVNKVHAATSTATPYRPATPKENVDNSALSKKFEGYLIVVQNPGINEDVPVHMKAKRVQVQGNNRVTLMKFEDRNLLKQCAPAYLQDYKVVVADKKNLAVRLKDFGASLIK